MKHVAVSFARWRHLGYRSMTEWCRHNVIQQAVLCVAFGSLAIVAVSGSAWTGGTF